MKKFKIPVSWEMYGFVEIEAETLDEAVNRAWNDNIPLPYYSEYVDESFRVDEEDVAIFNED